MSWFGLFGMTGADVPTPAAGKFRFFIDSSGMLSVKDSAGVVHTVVGSDQLGEAAALDVNVAGGVPVLDTNTKIPSQFLPAIALTETFVVNSQAAQLALSAQMGDVAIRTDQSKSYVHNGGTAGTMADWTELLTPGAPVQSVNGKTGAVSLVASDVGAQPSSAALTSIAGLSTSSNQGIYATGANTYSTYSLTPGGRALGGVAGQANSFPYFSAANTVSAATITAAGRALLDDADAAAQRTTLGLGTAATAAASDFATAAQGAKADSAVQPGSLATVATSGAYGDLTGRPTLGSAAAAAVSDFATAAQGAKADAAAVDTTVVHLAGAEEIKGSKRFTDPSTAPVKSETANAESLWLTRTGRTPGNPYNSVIRYRIEYTDSSNVTVYFGLSVSTTGVVTWGVGSSADLSTPANQWLAVSAMQLTCRVPATFTGTTTLRDIAFAADNTYNVGSASSRPIQYYGVNTTISSSDERLKTGLRSITDTEIAAFRMILRLSGVWQWIARVEQEGDAARLHSGPTVQAAIAIMDDHGLDWRQYAAFCYDEWPEQEEVVNSWPAEYDDEGNLIREGGSEIAQEYRPAGDRYSFRKEELTWWCLMAETAGRDAEIAEIKADILALKQAQNLDGAST